MLWGERRGNCIHRQIDVNRVMAPIGAEVDRPMEPSMRKPKQHKLNDLSRSLTTLDVHHTLIAVIEMSLSSWVVAGIVPGVERKPLKKLDTDGNALLKLLYGGERKRRGQDTRSDALRWPSRPAGMASGWRDGSERMTSRSTLFTHRV